MSGRCIRKVGLCAAAGLLLAAGRHAVAACCPWDCMPPGDGLVNVSDFLAMLSQWGQVGESCDFDDNGVNVNDFLELLAAWGPCP